MKHRTIRIDSSAATEARDDPSATISWVLIGVRLVVLGLMIANIPAWPSLTSRFHAIATTPGVPYRDFPVEYPIGALPFIELIGIPTQAVGQAILVVISFVADIGAYAAIRSGFGARAARRYLILGTPLLVFVYRRLDLVSVMLAVTSIVLAEKGREKAGGATLGLAILLRLWPVLLVPVLLIRHRRRALWVCGAVLVVGTICWVALAGGVGGIRQVVTFRGSTGYEVESSVGAVVWAVSGHHRLEQGANRTGTVSGWANAATVALLLVGLVALWRRARREPLELAGAPSLVAVAMLLLASPILSGQYIAWLLPWGAIAGETDVIWTALSFVPVLITGLVVAKWNLTFPAGQDWSQAFLITRNVSLAAIPLAWFVPTRVHPRIRGRREGPPLRVLEPAP